MRRGSPTEILPPSWPAGTAQMRSAGFFPYADAYAFSSPSLCAGRALSSPPYSPRRLSRCSSGAMCAFSRGRSQPGARKTGSIFRTGTAFSARSGCSKAASARERIMLSSAARAAGRSCASRAARERSASPARAAGTPLKRRPEEDAPPSVKIRPKPFKRLKELAVCKLQAASSFHARSLRWLTGSLPGKKAKSPAHPASLPESAVSSILFTASFSVYHNILLLT